MKNNKLLEIMNLKVEIENKVIIPDLSLTLDTGKIYVIMGPNGSGKSTLANAIAGSPKYKVTSGKLTFKNKDITSLKPDKRAQLGIFLSFQYPQEISGVPINIFLRESYNVLNPNNKLSILEFKKHINEKAKQLDLKPEFLSRYLNEGFSGGEKKKSEMLQLLTLNPDFAILDETDSGLDIDALRLVAKGINQFISQNRSKTVLIITHYKRLLEYLKIDKVFIMKEGKIINESEGSKITDELEEKGYSFLSDGENDDKKI
ncbi:Fe-S cluster assembly ATPase SufC [Candidatus Pacearchaeota archaeon CG10_big_fil_rev_8_21_14_0_10_32_14]|nr:MAG: Fe-S cluster assembly ATPase SufC [Candidatus Pacearchaeota archaeon CG10_big_fil_rev_8_21_14_0_10_32_14]